MQRMLARIKHISPPTFCSPIYDPYRTASSHLSTLTSDDFLGSNFIKKEDINKISRHSFPFLFVLQHVYGTRTIYAETYREAKPLRLTWL